MQQNQQVEMSFNRIAHDENPFVIYLILGSFLIFIFLIMCVGVYVYVLIPTGDRKEFPCPGAAITGVVFDCTKWVLGTEQGSSG